MKRDTTIKNDLLIRTLLGETTERTPVWMMRQAGRYLPEYIRLREKYSFLKDARILSWLAKLLCNR